MTGTEQLIELLDSLRYGLEQQKEILDGLMATFNEYQHLIQEFINENSR